MVQRVYRPDRRCPHCGSHWMPKAGFSRGKQTYRCGECHHRPRPEGNRHYHAPQAKGQAWEMYGEGLSIAAISRVLGLPELTALTWIKKVRQAGVERARREGEQRAARDPEQRAAVISLDELGTYSYLAATTRRVRHLSGRAGDLSWGGGWGRESGGSGFGRR